MTKLSSFLVAVACLILVPSATAQYTTVTATVVDSDSTAWANGTCSALYAQVPNFPGQLTNAYTGQPLSPNPVTCTLDGSGNMSISLVQTKYVYGPGGPSAGNSPGVIFSACPAVSPTSCYSTGPVVIAGSSQSVSTQINAQIKAPRISGLISSALAYNDAEVAAVNGNQYTRIADGAQRCRAAGVWGSCGGGGGGTPGSPAGSEQYNNGGAFGGTTTIYIPPSGVEDSAAIQAACNTGVLVHLASAPTSAPFVINTGVVMNPPCAIGGEGPAQTNIKHTSATADTFAVTYTQATATAAATVLKGGIIEGLMITQDAGVPATAGAAIDVGTNSTSNLTMGLRVRDVQINNVYDGLHIQTGSYIDYYNNITVTSNTHSCVNYDAATPTGDQYLDNITCQNDVAHGPNTGVIEGHGDVHEYTNLKINGSAFVFSGVGFNALGNLNNCSIESQTLTTYNLDLGTGQAPQGWILNGCEMSQATAAIGHYNSFAEISGCFQNVSELGSAGNAEVCYGITNLINTINGASKAVSLVGPYTAQYGSNFIFSPNTYQDYASFAASAQAVTAYTSDLNKTFTDVSSTWGLSGVLCGAASLTGALQVTCPGGTASTYVADLDSLTPSSANYTVGATETVLLASGQVGLGARGASGANTNYMCFYTDSSGYAIYSEKAGVAVLMAGPSGSQVRGTAYNMTCTVSGTSTTTVTLAINGSTVLTGTDSSSPTTAAGQAAFRLSGASTASLTNFYVTGNPLVNNPITSATGGTNTGTVTCTTANCTNLSGTYSVAGGTFTTGNLLTLVWPTTTTPYKCWTSQNGGIATYGIGHGVATATGMTITAGISVIGVTVTIDYGCSQI